MNDRAMDIVKHLARTTVLIAGLGLLLYAVVMAIAELSFGHWLIGLVLTAPMTALMAFVVVDALRTGVLPVWRGVVFSREHQPVAYWFHTGIYAVGSLLLGSLAVWNGVELIAVVIR